MDSDAQEDKCGVCMGDGKKCTTMKGDYSKQEGYGKAFTISVFIYRWGGVIFHTSLCLEYQLE